MVRITKFEHAALVKYQEIRSQLGSCSLAQLGHVLGVSRERARQLMRGLSNKGVVEGADYTRTEERFEVGDPPPRVTQADMIKQYAQECDHKPTYQEAERALGITHGVTASLVSAGKLDKRLFNVRVNGWKVKQAGTPERIAWIKENSPVTSRELAEKFNLTHNAANRFLRAYIKNGDLSTEDYALAEDQRMFWILSKESKKTS